MFLLLIPYFFFNAVYSCSTLILKVIKTGLLAWVGLSLSLVYVSQIHFLRLNSYSMFYMKVSMNAEAHSNLFSLRHTALLDFFSLEVIKFSNHFPCNFFAIRYPKNTGHIS